MPLIEKAEDRSTLTTHCLKAQKAVHKHLAKAVYHFHDYNDY